MRVAFVYAASPREELLAAVGRGEAPDTGLLGMNHLRDLGVDAWIHRPRLRRRHRAAGLTHRLTWIARELTLPWEVPSADAVCTPLGALFPLAAKVRGRPPAVVFNISFCTALERLRGLRRRTLAASLRSAAAVVCFASAQRRRLLAQIGGDPERVHVVLLGVDETFYHPDPPNTQGYVLAVGRDLGRDYATFTAAARRLGHPTKIVASRRNVRGIDLPPNVELCLDVPPLELRRLYAGAACVVVPTRTETFRFGADCSGQTVLLDAMASARPVVASDRATMREYIEPDSTGLLVPPEDADALAVAVRRVLDDDTLASRIGAAARKRVEERHTTRKFAERMVHILRQTVDAGR